MTLNPIERLNAFDQDLIKELRKRAFSKELVKTRSPFLRFTTAANMADLSDPAWKRNLGPQFQAYADCQFFTLGLHGWNNLNYSSEDLYGTKSDNGLVVGTTYSRDGQQRLVYTHNEGSVSPKNYPPPGITSVKVERSSKNLGMVLKFTIEIQCHTQKQLEVLDAACFVPGMTCILEWGSEATTPTGVETINYKLDFTKIDLAKQHILDSFNISRQEFITKWCKGESVGNGRFQNNFNYDWAVANIYNVKTELNDNIYKVTVMAMGKADSVMNLTGYSTSNPLTGQALETEKTNISTVQEYFKLNGRFSGILKQLADNTASIPERYRNSVVKFRDDVNRAEQAGNVPASTDSGQANDLGLEDTYFITFDAFIGLIVNGTSRDGILGMVNSGTAPNYNVKALIAPLTDNPANPAAEGADTIYCGYNKYLRSANPETMIIFNDAARDANRASEGIKSALISQVGTQQEINSGRITAPSPVIGLLEKSKFGAELSTKESGITPLFKGVWINSKAIQSAFINARTFMEGMEVLLNNINAATTNYWDLKLYYDDDKQMFRILDDNVRGSDLPPGSAEQPGIYEFNKKLNSFETDTVGPDVISVQVNTDYPKLLATQLAISSLNGGAILNDPSRRDIDFIRNTSVRDIFKDLGSQPAPSTAVERPVSRAPSTETVAISTFTNNLFTSAFNGVEQTIRNSIQSSTSSTLTSAFGQNVPKAVADLISDLYKKQNFLTVAEATDIRNKLSTLKNSGQITPTQAGAIATLFAERSKVIIRNVKTIEKNNFKVAYDTWRNNPQGGAGASNLTQRPVEVVHAKIDVSQNKFIKIIDDAARAAGAPSTPADVREGPQTGRIGGGAVPGSAGRGGP